MIKKSNLGIQINVIKIMFHMKKVYFVISILTFISSATFGQSFEGTIDFTQVNGTDTSLYKYYVKGNNVRVDNFDTRTKNNEGTFLIDLSTKKLTALSPVRKIYFDQPSGTPIKATGTPKVTKTSNVKKINGYSCTEYDVTDAEEGLKISYWMASGHFEFFVGMLQILNRKDKYSEYFLEIPNTQGMFPMFSEQWDLQGNKKGSMKAHGVTKAPQSDEVFKIPPGYKEFKK